MTAQVSKRPMFFDDEGAVMSPLVFSHSSESSSSPNSNSNSNSNSNNIRNRMREESLDSRGSGRYNRISSSKSKEVSFDDSETHHYRRRNIVSPTSSSSTQMKNNRGDGSPAFDPFAIHSGSGSNSRSRSFDKPEQSLAHPQRHQRVALGTTKDVLKKVLLPSNGHGKSGPIQYRADIPSMLLKKWHTGYWLHVYPATINVFESMEDMDQWKDMNDRVHHQPIDKENNGPSYGDSKATKKQMDKIVKASINFDTTGDLRKKMKKLEDKNKKLLGGEGGTGGRSVGSGSRPSPRKQKVSDCSDCSFPVNYVMEKVRSKYYRKNDPLMHTFKISYLGLSGRNVSAAFGSSEPQEVKRLRAVIRDVLHLAKKASKKRSKQDKGAFGETASTMIFTKASHSAKSEITALSNTVYGRNTMTETAKKVGNSRHF